MCEKCTEIDAKIARLKVLAARVLDQPTIEGIKQLIEEKLTQKGPCYIPKRCRCAKPCRNVAVLK